jgi:uncharacterized membrane protein
VRFHAFQNIFLCVAWTVLWFGAMVLTFIPYVNLLMIAVWPLLGLAGLVLWILCLVKAYGGQKWQIPVIGKFAEEQANK